MVEMALSHNGVELFKQIWNLYVDPDQDHLRGEQSHRHAPTTIKISRELHQQFLSYARRQMRALMCVHTHTHKEMMRNKHIVHVLLLLLLP